MDLGFNIKELFNRTRRESNALKGQDSEAAFSQRKKAILGGADGGGGVFRGEGILNGKKKSMLEVGAAIRTGVRLGSISKEAALNSKWAGLLIIDELRKQKCSG